MSKGTCGLGDRRAAMKAEIEAMAARIELQLLAEIMRAPAGWLPQISDDPIFAVIEAHSQAKPALRSRHAEDEIARAAFTAEPTTVAGAAALMTYALELIAGSDGRADDWNDDWPLFWSLPLHRNLARALAKIAAPSEASPS
jgi:hypothetical protein